MTRTTPALVHRLVRAKPGSPTRFEAFLWCGLPNTPDVYAVLSERDITCPRCKTPTADEVAA